jgi:hypothetical protein
MHPDSNLGPALRYLVPLAGEAPAERLRSASEISLIDPACGAPRGAIKQYLKGESVRKVSSMPQYC